MRPRHAAQLPLVLVFVLGAGSDARANPFELFGASARDVAMGGAMTAAAFGPGALHHNPSLLLRARAHSLTGGLRLTLPALSVERSPVDAAPRAVLPEPTAGFTLGWVKPLGGVLEDRVAIGLSVATPATRLLRIEGLDPAQPQFHLYQSLQEKLLIHLGAAVEAVEGFAIGAGVQILANVGGAADLGLDVPSDGFTRRELDVSLAPTVSPVVGLRYAPSSSLALGLTWRGENALRFVLPVSVYAGEALSLDIALSQTVMWTPHQLAAGLAFTPDSTGLTIALDLTYGLWSRAPDPSPRLSVDVGGRLVEAFGFDRAFDLSTRQSPIDLGFSNTLTARAGLEWRAADWLALRGGYFFRPTPAPPQTGATAYLDNDAHAVSAGLGFSVLNPAQDRPSALDLDLAAQATVLPRRVALRPDGYPGGSLAHGGVVWHFAFSGLHRF
jgi:long-chain fatty acid transport protein